MRYSAFVKGMNPSLPPLSFRILFILVALVSPRIIGAQPADLVVQHANVITIDTNAVRVRAFAVAGEKFVATCSDEFVNKFIGAGTKVLDLTGKTVVPGFIDAHLHPQALYPRDSRWASVDCSPAGVRTIEEMVAALKR